MGSRPVVVAAGRGSWIATRALGLVGAHPAAGLVLVDMPVDEDAIESGVSARLALPTLVVRGGLLPAPDSAAREAFNAGPPFRESAHLTDSLGRTTDRDT